MPLENLNVYTKTDKSHMHPVIENLKKGILDLLASSDWENLKDLSKKLNNLFSRFLETIKGKDSQDDDQELLFESFCGLINILEQNFLGINNNIPKTWLEQYNNNQIWEQLFHNSYIENLWKDVLCEWWDHSYWTLLLYNIFEKLKNTWLDLDMRIFRFKNLNARMMEMDMGGYSWLIIKFHESYYLVDSWRIFRLNGLWKIVKPINNLIDSLKNEEFERRKKKPDISLLNKLKDWKNNNQFIFFDNIEDFIKNIHEYPESPHISLYVDEYNNPNSRRWHIIHFYFTHNWVKIEKGSDSFEYIFKENFIPNEKTTIDDLIGNVQIISRTYWNDDQCINILMNSLKIIKDKIDFVKLCEYYSNIRNDVHNLDFFNSFFHWRR